MKKYVLLLIITWNFLPGYAQESLWKMPACSWKRNLGDRPVYTSTKIYESPGLKPGTMTKRGMPLGGIGSGSFMYNLCGSFGPFHMKPGLYEERFLQQAAFHIREEYDGQATGYTLATEDVLPAWNKLRPGDATYTALFPKATFDYRVFRNPVSLLYFSPVIRDNYRETSYPVGIFLFKVKNRQAKPVNLSFMFTFPNIPAVEANDTACTRNRLRPCRNGLFNRAEKTKQYTAVVLSADDPQNAPETQHTAWCMAAPAHASYVDCWDGAGDGQAIWNDFMHDGRLSGRPLCTASPLPSSALCVSVRLKPGEEAVIPFALSWDFPLVTFNEGTSWRKRYTEYFPAGTEPCTALAIAAEGLKSYAAWLEKVDAWVDPIAGNPDCPDWLKAGALNELYYNTFGGSFWENGCVNQEKRFGNRKGQHISGVMECTAYPYLETFDVRQHAARVTRDLWPEIEKDILLAYSDIIASTTLGSCPHDFGSPYRNPVNRPDAYVSDYRKGKGKETTPWSEFSPKFIQQVFMYWKQYDDDAFLDECWLSVIRSFNYQVATDKNNDGITEMSSSEYNGNKLLNAVLWIASLEALHQMATYRNDTQTAAATKAQLEKARKNSEIQFWNDRYGYYQYNESIPFLMADAFIGQRCADVFDLPPVLDKKRMLSHFRQCFDRLVKPLKDYDADGIGDLGAANIVTPESKPGVGTSEHNHEYEVWTGVSYNLAATMYHWGKQTGDRELMKNALLTGRGNYMQCWLNEENGFWFGTPEAYWWTDMPKARGNMYQRVRGIWELMQEVANPGR